MKILLAILLALSVAGCDKPAPLAPEPPMKKAGAVTKQSAADVKAVKGRILIQPKVGVSKAELDSILAAYGAKPRNDFESLKKLNVFVFDLVSTADDKTVLSALRKNAAIQFVELDARMPPALAVNDPLFGSQWHLPNIGAPTAWDARTGAGVTIAILDTGTDPAHPDLVAQLVPGWNAYDNNSNTADVYGHGTWTAGTAAAAGNNGIGVAGVAFGARIMPVRITDTSGYAYYSTMSNGITWAADHGARVASISFLGVTSSSTVISAAQYMRNKGGVVVAASGNSGALESYPATDAITSVGAIDSTGNLAWFSSSGGYLDLAGPGQDIYTTSNGGGYESVSGTSFSTPLVAAVYALVMSANPNMGPAQLDGILFTTATDAGPTGKDVQFGWGVVNASAAVAKALSSVIVVDTTPPVVTMQTPRDGETVSGTVIITASATDNDTVTSMILTIDGKVVASGLGSSVRYAWQTDKGGKGKGSSGRRTIVVTAKDPAGNFGTGTVTVTIN